MNHRTINNHRIHNNSHTPYGRDNTQQLNAAVAPATPVRRGNGNAVGNNRNLLPNVIGTPVTQQRFNATVVQPQRLNGQTNPVARNLFGRNGQNNVPPQGNVREGNVREGNGEGNGQGNGQAGGKKKRSTVAKKRTTTTKKSTVAKKRTTKKKSTVTKKKRTIRK